MKNFFKKVAQNGRSLKRRVLSVWTGLMTLTLSGTTAAFAASTTAMPAFFNDALGILQTVVILIGGGLAVWGIINLLEGYGNDNPGAKSQGMKQLMAGIGVALIGILLVPQLGTLFSTSTSTP